ncbi:MAG: hypothetical protein ABEJ69_02100 [Candidatus Nanohaloarchaea archaeon]
MAGPKSLAALILAFGLFIGPAAATQFQVQISDLTSFNQATFNVEDAADPLHEVNTSIENTGSVGCMFRLRAEYNHSGTTFERWSEGYALWPGETAVLEIEYLPYNYTGAVKGQVELRYCGQTADLGEFSFNSSERVVTNQTVETETLNSNSSSAAISLDVENGTLVPYRAPAGWKTATAEIEDGRAIVEYEPYLFHPEREIQYNVLKNGEIVGTSTVEIAVEPDAIDRIKANALEILLLLSAALNLVLLAKHPSAREKLVKPLK